MANVAASRHGRERFKPQHSLTTASYFRVSQDIAANTPAKKAALAKARTKRKRRAKINSENRKTTVAPRDLPSPDFQSEEHLLRRKGGRHDKGLRKVK
jgi:hypothetical protein